MVNETGNITQRGLDIIFKGRNICDIKIILKTIERLKNEARYRQ